MQFITGIFTSLLVSIYAVTGNLGLTILAFTIIIRVVLLPLTIPSIKTQKQLQSLQPELSKLKKKHGKDSKALQLAQMNLYKKYNINPLAGCLPQLLQIAVLFLLYHALTTFISQDQVNGAALNTQFLWLNLTNPDQFYIIPVLAGVTQFLLSLMILPATEIKDEVPNKSKNKKVREENKKEEDVAEMAQTMQQQMIIIMPIMTGIFALQFPSGLGLYWIATTVASIIQQYIFSGPGGIVLYSQRAVQFVRTNILKSQ